MIDHRIADLHMYCRAGLRSSNHIIEKNMCYMQQAVNREKSAVSVNNDFFLIIFCNVDAY